MCNPVCLEVLGDLRTVCGDAPTILNLKGNKFSGVMKPVEAYKVARKLPLILSPHYLLSFFFCLFPRSTHGKGFLTHCSRSNRVIFERDRDIIS